MPYTVDINDYANGMNLLLAGVTDPRPAGGRMARSASTVIEEVTVTDGSHSVTLLLQVSDLYIIGFENDHGTFRFNDHVAHGATTLPIGCSYTASGAVGILRESGSLIETSERSQASIVSAIIQLSGYQPGGGVDIGMKKNLGIMMYLISEALRFKSIRTKMEAVLSYIGSFSFAEFRAWVTNWAALSAGGMVDGVPPDDVQTYQ